MVVVVEHNIDTAATSYVCSFACLFMFLQCDQIKLFLKGLHGQFSNKVVQMDVDFWDNFGKCQYLRKHCSWLLFGQLLEKVLALFIPVSGHTAFLTLFLSLSFSLIQFAEDSLVNTFKNPKIVWSLLRHARESSILSWE